MTRKFTQSNRGCISDNRCLTTSSKEMQSFSKFLEGLGNRFPSITVCPAEGGNSLSTGRRRKWKGKKKGKGGRMEGRRKIKKPRQHGNLLVKESRANE